MIRKCTIEDLPFITNLAIQFNEELHDVPLNLEKLHQFLVGIITNGVCLRGENSAIAGVVAEDPVRDWTYLVEMGWYSKTGEGVRLLKEFEKVGDELGVDEIRMTTLYANPDADSILIRLGYEPIETSHRLIRSSAWQ